MKIKKIFFVCFLIVIRTILFPQSALELYKQAQTEYFNENYKDAIYYLKLSLEKNPNYIDALIQLSKIYLEIENYEYAYTIINKALNLYPSNDYITLLAANTETMLGIYGSAEKKYQALLNKNPLNIEAYNGLITLYFKTDKKILAKKNLDKILSTAPENFEAINLMAKYYENIDINRADYFYQKNLEKNSLNPDSYFYYSIFKFNNNETIAALENIKRALEIKDRLIYKKYYGKYLLQVKQGDTAINVFREILKKTNDAIDFYNIALAYNIISNYEKVLESLKRAINLRNDDEIAGYLLNATLINNYQTDDQNRIDRSNYTYSEAIKAKKESQFALYLFLLKEAISLYPKNSTAREELAEYFLLSNLPERYIKELEVAARYSNNQSLLDKLSIEKRRISYRLGDDWNINQYNVEYDTFIIPLFTKENINNYHYEVEKTIAYITKNLYRSSHKFEAKPYIDKNYNNPEKSKIASELFSQFYIDLYVNESSNIVDIKAELINANNYQNIKTYKTTKQGNNKIVLAISSIIEEINKDIVFKAHIVKMNKNKAIINAGRNKNIKLKDEFIILKKKNYQVEFASSKYLYSSSDVKGIGKVIKVDENISEIEIKTDDFFNDIDIGDIVIYRTNSNK